MLSKFRFSVVLAVLAVLTACQDAKPVHVVLDGIARKGAEPMLMLTDELEPMADPTYVHKKRDLYDCEHVVAPWFQKVLMAELNYLSDKDKLQLINAPVCLLIVDKDLGPKEGRFSVHFYEDAQELRECAINHRCKLARNVSLVLKNQLVYRSYFLTDFNREKYYQHCITPDDMWMANTTCYVLP
ncbi:hypothetical protein [Limnohabitans sp.]|uniref:hypothetical protein n=1 Tax=Limnohabitans sp. TaxID=1907725 RepID=UPI00333E49BA